MKQAFYHRFFRSAKASHWCLAALLAVVAQQSQAGPCDLPPGVTVSGSYITGPMTLNIGGGATKSVNLYVNNVPYSDGRCAAQVFQEAVPLWQSLYNDYINRGITHKNIKRLADSIADVPGAGVYLREGLSACGYHGTNRTITCGPSASTNQKFTMAHENMHGWEFQFVTDQTSAIAFYNVFTHFSNLVHTAYMQNPSSLQGTNWSIYNKPTNQREVNWVYGMQNENEWGSEVFADWLLNGSSRAVWPYIQARQPAFVQYFDCLWKTDSLPSACARVIDAQLKIPTSDPRITPPASVSSNVVVDGVAKTVTFTQAQSQSIWNVCFGNQTNTSSAGDLAIVNDLIRLAAPNLPTNPAGAYRLGRADANHDNVYDWVCTYEGAGPGGSNYLWNQANKNGAFSFIVSGKAGDGYVEYKQDPFLQLPTAYNTLVQPKYREWQGQYNSAFGAAIFGSANGGNNQWYTRFTQAINSSTKGMLKPFSDKPLIVGNATWVNQSSEPLTLGWIGLGGGTGIMGTLPAGATQVWGPAYFSGINFARDSQGNLVLLYAINGIPNQTLTISNSALASARANRINTVPYMASLPNSAVGQNVLVNNHSGGSMDLVWYDPNGLPLLINTLAPGSSTTLTSARFGSMFALTNKYGLVSPYVVTDAANQSLTGTDNLVSYWKAQLGRTSSDTRCASEGGACSFTGMRFVSYGANGLYNSKIVQDSVTCNSATFGDPVPGVAKACFVGSNVFSHCAAENGRCNFTGTQLVAYGANGKFAWDVWHDGTNCNNQTFGDPAPSMIKACYTIPFTPLGLGTSGTPSTSGVR